MDTIHNYLYANVHPRVLNFIGLFQINAALQGILLLLIMTISLITMLCTVHHCKLDQKIRNKGRKHFRDAEGEDEGGNTSQSETDDSICTDYGSDTEDEIGFKMRKMSKPKVEKTYKLSKKRFGMFKK